MLFLVAVTVFMIGWIIVEFFTERRHLKEALPYMVDRNLKLAVAVDYKLTEDGLEITASEPIYDTVTYEISSFSLLGGQQSESFEFKKADNGRSATVKYNG